MKRGSSAKRDLAIYTIPHPKYAATFQNYIKNIFTPSFFNTITRDKTTPFLDKLTPRYLANTIENTWHDQYFFCIPQQQSTLYREMYTNFALLAQKKITAKLRSVIASIVEREQQWDNE